MASHEVADMEKTLKSANSDIQAASDSGNGAESVEIDLSNDPQNKRLLRRLDIRVVPPLFTLFVLSFLDRSNIGNARIQGLEESLGMEGQDYSIALFVFFITYILCEVPSNLILKKLSPSTWLSFILFAWGIVTIGIGFIHNFGSLIALRLVLGVFESGLFPGGTYLMSAYYARYELQWRFSLFVSGTIIAGAFGGIFAFALAKLDGTRGYEGWRWIFIIEGIITVVVAVMSKFWIVDWPDDVKFLSAEEKSFLQRKLAADAGGGARMDTLTKTSLKRILTDWKIYLGIIIHLCIVNSTYSVSFFLPTVIRELGFSSAEAQVRVIPVYVTATVVSLTCAWLTDRYRCRYLVVMLMLIPGIVGYGIQLAGTHVSSGVRYFSCFLVGITSFTVLPTVLAWVNFQLSGHYKRAIGTAMILGFGNLGGIVGSNIWLTWEAPTYVTGTALSLALLILCGLLSTVYFFGLRAENRRRERGGRDYRYTDEADQLDNMGDDHPAWRYTF